MVYLEILGKDHELSIQCGPGVYTQNVCYVLLLKICNEILVVQPDILKCSNPFIPTLSHGWLKACNITGSSELSL